ILQSFYIKNKLVIQASGFILRANAEMLIKSSVIASRKKGLRLIMSSVTLLIELIVNAWIREQSNQKK
ncbi:MAG: hypothetical protein P8M19_04695, partial [Crocinitomicaceae bacterium]|nr:hypothetical protein [Crocinitomicaceae bacterium]